MVVVNSSVELELVVVFITDELELLEEVLA